MGQKLHEWHFFTLQPLLDILGSEAGRNVVVSGILQHAAVEERGADPLERHGHIGHRAQYHLSVQVFGQVQVQADGHKLTLSNPNISTCHFFNSFFFVFW